MFEYLFTILEVRPFFEKSKSKGKALVHYGRFTTPAVSQASLAYAYFKNIIVMNSPLLLVLLSCLLTGPYKKIAILDKKKRLTHLIISTLTDTAKLFGVQAEYFQIDSQYLTLVSNNLTSIFNSQTLIRCSNQIHLFK